jgi:hypothetical protein
LHGISPIYDQAIFVRCHLCQLIIKLPQLAEHLRNYFTKFDFSRFFHSKFVPILIFLEKRHDITDDESLIETITNKNQEKIAVEEAQASLPSSGRNRKTSRSLKTSNLPNDLNSISAQQVPGNKILKSSPLKPVGKKQTNTKTFKSTNLKLLNENINEFIHQPESTIPFIPNSSTITNNLTGINGVIISNNFLFIEFKYLSNKIFYLIKKMI